MTLGYANAAEMQRQATPDAKTGRDIKELHLPPGEALHLHKLDQGPLSKITRGQFRGVSEAKLLELFAKLGHAAKIIVGKTNIIEQAIAILNLPD
jgi:Helix-turn-helix domain